MFLIIFSDIYKYKSHKRERNDTLKAIKKLLELKKSESVSDLSNVGGDLYFATRQMQLQQFQELEKARSDGYSGIKQLKTTTGKNNAFIFENVCYCNPLKYF